MWFRAKRRSPNRRFPAKPARKQSRRRQLLRWISIAGCGFYGACLVALLYLQWLPPLTTGVQLQRRVAAWLSWKPYDKHYLFIPLEEMSPHLAHAAVASEDARFFEHSGIDWLELEKVLDRAQRRGRFSRGGSTITQQLVKNVFLTTHRSWIRKGLEFTLTPLAEFMLSKKRILELYLNVVEWGPGVYGAEAAARYHYGVSAKRLTRAEAARLVACLPAPLERQPQDMGARAEDISERMRDMGW
ncbi:MAG: monofunctional biosynthetic peptidoglycan transglycosylase [Candidatus Binatia bacterium]